MDKRFYVSLEAARLLKEKGYNEECDWAIDDDSDIYECDEYRINQDLPEWKWSCPTKAEVIDWLECKGIYIESMFDFEPSIKDHKVLWCYVVYNKIERCGYKENYIFHTRLEAEEDAIIRALKEINKL